MTAAHIEHVFGRTRQRMVTGPHVEVFREAAAPGERRRYTKRFLPTPEGDFRDFTARESRILAHLASHGVRGVPALVAPTDGTAALQTFDAGVTVEHWVTLLHVERAGRVLPHVFADCAHWWALARNTLRVLETLHLLGVVHLDLKPDNICVPVLPADFAADVPGATISLQFARLALIDFSFSLLPAEPLTSPLPIGPQPAYAYQSPRLLHALAAGRAGDPGPTQALDWRCDMYGLAAMLRRYLPDAGTSASVPEDHGWTGERHARGMALLAALDEAHDRDAGPAWAHQALIEMCESATQEEDLVASLLEGFALAPADAARVAAPLTTPLTRLEPAPAKESPTTPLIRSKPAVDNEPPTPPLTRIEPTLRREPQSSPLTGIEPALATEPPPAITVAATKNTSPSHTGERAPAAAGTLSAAPVHADAAGRTLSPSGAVRDAALPLHPPSRPWRSRTAGAVIVAALILVVSVAVVQRQPRHDDPVTAQDNDSASSSGSSVRRAPDDRVVTAPPVVASSARDSVRDSLEGGAQRQGGELAMDAATVQRAAEAESNLKMMARAGDTASTTSGPPPEAASTAPVQWRDTPSAIAGTQSKADDARSIPPAQLPATVPTPSPQSSETVSAPPQTLSPSRQARETQPADPRSAPVAQPHAPPAMPSTAPRPPLVAERQAPPATPAAAPARPEERGVAMTGHPALEDVIARTERDVARVLTSAANAAGPGDAEKVVQVARSMHPVSAARHLPTGSRTLARQLNASARAAWERNDVNTALKLQQAAFRENPNDPEVTGNLAFFYLKVRPAQPELARRLALYALAARGQAFPAGRVEDWGTLAVASSLEGRQADAVKAMYVMSTLSRNPERACRAARLAVEQYGEPMRAPANAMLSRMRARGEIPGAPSCG